MAGRHSKPSTGRRGISLPVVAAILLLAAACAAGVVVFVKHGGSSHKASSGCSGKVTVNVDAAPGIAEPVQTIANRWTATHPNAEGKCIDVSVTPLPSSNVEQILAAGGSGGGENAAMWIPDSSTWATRLTDDITASGRDANVEVHAPIAVSPLVFVASPTAKYPTNPDWQPALNGSFPLAIPDPVSNTDGLLSLQIMNSLKDSSGQGPAAAVASSMLRLSHATLPDANAGFAELAADPGHAPVFTAPEQTVIQADKAKQSLFARAIYPDSGTLNLDYPVVRLVRSGDDPALTAALDDLEQQLRAPAAQTYLHDAGFRDPSGAPVPGVGAAEGVAAAKIRQLDKLSPGQGVDTLRLWESVTEDVNSLLVIDVSGSMAEAGGGGKSKIQLTAAAARGAIDFYPDTSNVGMWVFSTKQTATTDYKELVPIGELDARLGNQSRRQALINAANSLPSQVQGNTGLYNSLLAAVRDVRKNYDPSKVNTVIFMTDGQNDNASGLTLDKLISTLKAENSPLPIPVFTIAIGPDADAAGLHKISQATGGKGYVVKDPTTIRDVFLDAVVQRQCRSNC